jgi:hypothetical protein
VFTRPTTCAALALALATAGCAKQLPETPKPVPVRGKVLLPGNQPLHGGIITFHPLANPPDRRYMGQAFPKRDGTFALTTLREGDGVAPGLYRVTISPREEGEPKGSNANLIPKKYHADDTSPLQVEVKEGENDFAPFVLQ